MAANPQSQHRCVFVGNIPYDATEEQLVQICEEVGPVVSFRLVIDRETGKPKGYGFCEYKDEETAQSARRNLQGYEINGRQLRVDFAENDKNADRNREQGRGGPGVAPNVDAQKQFGGPAVLGPHPPIGDAVAMAAATVMAGALGSAQTASTSTQIGLQNQSLLGTDPLTRHLAKMSRSQLMEVLSELKAMATQNKEQARQLLLAIPNLPKALFQAQIMLGIVSPQMLQMPSMRQSSAQPLQSLVQNSQTLPVLPLLPQNKMQFGVLPYALESRASASQSNQFAALQNFPTEAQIQRPQLTQCQVIQQTGVSSYPYIHPKSLSGLSVGQQIHLPTSSSFNQQMLHSLSQDITSVTPTISRHNQLGTVNSHTSVHVDPQFASTGFQLSSTSSGMVELDDLKSTNQMNRASKTVKLNGTANPSPQVVNIAFPTSDIPGRQVSRTEANEKQATQVQFPSDVDAALLQQVLNLTPDQLSSLPPEQQQQVIQLQRMLRQAT